MTTTQGNTGHGWHLPSSALDPTVPLITWYPLIPRTGRARVPRWTCECRLTVCHLVTGDGRGWVGNATVSEHFRFDRAFHAQAKQARKTQLHGPAPDTSWHPRLPGLLASGVSIPQAARRVGRSAVTVRAHLRRYADLCEAVNTALRAKGLPCLPGLWSAEP